MQLNLPVLPASFFVMAFSLFFISNIVFYVILGEVNGKRKPEERFGLFFLNFKVTEILRLHRGFYPTSNKRTLMWVAGLLGVALLVGTILANARFVSPDQLRTHHPTP